MVDSKQSDPEKKLADDGLFVSSDPEVGLELERILTSDFFKTSARCRDFLKHVVWVACSDSADSLKERTIGIAVFGRAPDYDTGSDAIVRVKASEVRRRLAQYNQIADPQRTVAIELSPGSYAPKITKRTTPQQPVMVIPAKGTFGKVIGIGAVVGLIAALAWIVYASYIPSSLKRFWEPFLGRDKPIICTTHPGAYYMSLDQLAIIGDSSEAFKVSKKLQSMGRSSRIVLANDVTSADLNISPVILLGGPKYNHWTAELTQGLRFYFNVVDGRPRIIDRDNPARFWENKEPEKALNDYAVVSRLVASNSRKTVISVAGLKAYGSRTGTELVFDATTLDKVLKFAPEDWDKKNMQFVIRIDPNKGDNPELVATTYW